MQFTAVAPIFVQQQPAVPVVRPDMSSPEVKRTRRNLFGSPQKGETDEMFRKEQNKILEHLNERYNFDLSKIEKMCNQQQQQQQQEQQQQQQQQISKFVNLPGLKRTFTVRKVYTKNSSVPKRICNENNHIINSSNNNNNNNIKQNNNNSKVDSHISEMGAKEELKKQSVLATETKKDSKLATIQQEAKKDAKVVVAELKAEQEGTKEEEEEVEDECNKSKRTCNGNNN